MPRGQRRAEELPNKDGQEPVTEFRRDPDNPVVGEIKPTNPVGDAMAREEAKDDADAGKAKVAKRIGESTARKAVQIGDDDWKRMRAVMERCHKALYDADVTFEAVMLTKDKAPVKLHGMDALGTTKVTSLEDRVLGHSDFRMRIDGKNWANMVNADRDGLIDHLMSYLELVVDDETGDTKFDDHHRPRLKMRKPDWSLQGFKAVAGRNGEHAPEVQAACQWKAAYGQMCFEFGLKPG